MLAAKKGEFTSLYQYSNVIYVLSAVIIICLLNACNVNGSTAAAAAAAISSTEAEPIFAPEHIERSCIEKCPDQVSAKQCLLSIDEKKITKKNWLKCVCVRKKLVKMRAKDELLLFFRALEILITYNGKSSKYIKRPAGSLKNSNNKNNNSIINSNWIIYKMEKKCLYVDIFVLILILVRFLSWICTWWAYTSQYFDVLMSVLFVCLPFEI